MDTQVEQSVTNRSAGTYVKLLVTSLVLNIVLSVCCVSIWRSETSLPGDIGNNNTNTGLEMEVSSVWKLLSKEQKEPAGVMTDRFIMKFDRYMDWNILSSHYDFNVQMLRIYFHRVNWSLIVQRIKLPESFLREMAPSFNSDCWTMISKYQILSESFIHDYVNRLDQEYIAVYQNMSGLTEIML